MSIDPLVAFEATLQVSDDLIEFGSVRDAQNMATTVRAQLGARLADDVSNYAVKYLAGRSGFPSIREFCEFLEFLYEDPATRGRFEASRAARRLRGTHTLNYEEPDPWK